MEKLALFRKYRPTDFSNLIGQEFIKTTLTNAFKSENVSHAYLFSGPRGTGKTSTARLIAKMLNCESPDNDFNPCGKCEFCRNINDGNLIDLVEIDAASNRGIDEIRQLKETINFQPTHSKYKIYIIDEVHMLTTEAFNALLKTLEEPPEYAYFILATTEIHKIPETIISRCQRFDFRRIADEDLISRLKFIAKNEKINVEDGVYDIIAANVSGGMRDAIGLLEQFTIDNKITKENIINALGIADNSIVLSIINALENGDGNEALKNLDFAYSQGYDLINLSDKIIAELRNRMLLAINKNDTDKSGLYIGIIKTILNSRVFTESGVPQLALEVAFIKVAGCKEYNFDDTLPISSIKKNKVIANSSKPKTESSDFAKEKPIKQKTALSEADANINTEVKPNSQEKTEKKVYKQLPTKDKKTKMPVTEKEKSVGNSDITREWSNLIEGIKSPAIRMSLKTARISDIDGTDVVLEFNSKFHMEKSIGTDAKSTVENLAYKLTGINYKFSGVVNASESTPSYRNEKKDEESKPDENQSTEDIAMGIFG